MVENGFWRWSFNDSEELPFCFKVFYQLMALVADFDRWKTSWEYDFTDAYNGGKFLLNSQVM